MAGNIKELNANNFDDFIKKGDCIVDFYADWCGPCKAMASHFEKAVEKLKDVKFGKINVDGNQKLTGRFMVMSVPTTIFFKNREQVDRHTGAMSFEDIRNFCERNF
ncbi:MAG: thioredoxin family protein [Nanoarchaeota archaeon]|nr:thioredoxin family protein [Nanoarchaeota archaeon]